MASVPGMTSVRAAPQPEDQRAMAARHPALAHAVALRDSAARSARYLSMSSGRSLFEAEGIIASA